jgi:hypothetical protein
MLCSGTKATMTPNNWLQRTARLCGAVFSSFVLIDIYNMAYCVVFYEYAEDRPCPNPTPTQHRGCH